MSDGQEPQGEEGGEQQVGWTSEIHEAVWQNNTEKVRQLINNPQGAPLDLEAVVEDCTPLYLACLKGHTDVAEILIKGGAKVDGDSPPVFAAAGKGNLDLVRLLLKNGANPSAFSSQHAGCCGLHIAAEKNYVDAGADINAGTTINTTSLHSVVKWGNPDAVRFMLDHGADPNVRTTKGELPIDFAKEPAIRALLEPVTKAAAKTDKPTNGPADAKGAKADKNVSRSKYSHDNWQPDNTTPECMHCSKKFTLIVRKHHCRNCGQIFCDQCTPHRMRLPDKGMKEPVRVCVVCADTNTNTKAKSN